MGRLKGGTTVIPTFIIYDKWRWLARPYASQIGRTIYIRRGLGDVEALSAAREILAEGGVVALAPEGRPTRGALTRAKPGVAYLACETGVPVWPLAIFGHERIFDFLKRLQRAPVRIALGKSLILNSCADAENHFEERADTIMRAIAELMPAEYHGVYSGPKTQPASHVNRDTRGGG
jgi:1-acyl-sn-glycerol-3-phosphate acyltransferase